MRIAANYRTRKSPMAVEADEPGLLDRRRWASFLTWAFVLAEMAGRDGLPPTAAHAADENMDQGSHGGSTSASSVNNLPTVPVSTGSDGPAPVPAQQAASAAPLPNPTAHADDLTEAKIALGADELGHGGVGVGVGAGYSESAQHHALSSFADGDGVQLALGEIMAFDKFGVPLDLGLNLDLDLGRTLQTVLDNVSNGLEGLPLVGGLLDSFGSALNPVTSLVGLGSSHDEYGMGASGQIHFAQSAPSASDLLNAGGGHTNYGIALNLGEAGIGLGSASGHDAATGASVLDPLSDDRLLGIDLHTVSDALHVDQAVLRTAADILA
jgi:hypothetical protein